MNAALHLRCIATDLQLAIIAAETGQVHEALSALSRAKSELGWFLFAGGRGKSIPFRVNIRSAPAWAKSCSVL